MAKDAKIVFDNCESAAKCIEQRTHRICGRDFVVRKEKPTQGMKDKIRANLRQNMPGPPSENLSAANVQSNPPVESNLGNESPQSTASSSSEESIIFCGKVSGECPQNRGLASFDRPGSASHENVSAANVQSDPPAESNLGNQSPQATASNSTQVQGTECSTISKERPQSGGLASFDKPGSASNENLPAVNVQSDTPAESHVGNQSSASNSTQVQGSVTDCSAISREWAQSRGLASFDKPG
ncbi:hypothetical protein Ddc_14381 [Ditylenchus destructor]|nr:hypothetical protein Ddc_14381 [Ditylenchus destructor]